jgi:hypothetical protein
MRLPQILLPLVLLVSICPAQDTNFSVGPQYLVPPNHTMFLRPIATPSMSLDAPLPGPTSLPPVSQTVTDQPHVPVYEPASQPDLFPIYYGYPSTPVVELTGTPPSELPASLNEAGFVELSDPESLRQMGFGKAPAEAASFWKTHKRTSPRVYTNADIQRLPKS